MAKGMDKGGNAQSTHSNRGLALRAARVAAIQYIYRSMFQPEFDENQLIAEFEGEGRQAVISLYPQEFLSSGVGDNLAADPQLFKTLIKDYAKHNDDVTERLNTLAEEVDEKLPYGENLFEIIILIGMVDIQRNPKRAIGLLDEYVSLVAMFYENGLTGVANAILSRFLQGITQTSDSDIAS